MAQRSIYTELATSFISKVEIILHMKIVFKQHIKQYIQCVLVYISNMLILGGGNQAYMMYDVSFDILGSTCFKRRFEIFK